ncbi:MAG TPA: CHAT domain-containing protein [Thermoanaerobaculia bacterium]
MAESGETRDALAAGRHSIALYIGLREYENAVFTGLRQTEAIRNSEGDSALWKFTGQTLAWAGAVNSRWLNSELFRIAQDAVEERSWDVARSATTLIVDSDPDESYIRVNARILRAIAAWNQRDVQTARQDLQQARSATATDPRIRIFENRTIAGAELALKRQSDRSTHLLEKALAAALDSRDVAESCAFFLNRAREFRKLNKHREAAAELSHAFRLLAQSPAAIAADQMGYESFGLSTDIHNELIDLLDRRGEAADAFAVSETGRGRRLLERMGFERSAPLTVDGVRRAIPRGTLIVSFVTLRDRLLIFSIDQSRSHVTHVPIERDELQKQVNALTSAIAQRADWRSAAMATYEILFGAHIPVRSYDTLVIVPDAVLERVPFAVLIDSATRRVLIEQSAVVIAPSASIYANFSALREAPREKALTVGDPHFDSALFPRLPRLPSAVAEAKTIAAIYGMTPLIGDSAQSSKVLDGAANAGIIHIGAHTLINTDDPMQSSIVMSDGQLCVRDLASRRVRLGSIAILAGCRTATRIGKSDINSLALAFLAAGSRSSVGSLWDVEDAATRRFSVRLHQLLRAGTPVSQAVRHAQLEMLRSSDPTLSAPHSWAAFQVYGAP